MIYHQDNSRGKSWINTLVTTANSSYRASMGLIGIPGVIDKVAVENSVPLLKREGTSKSCLHVHKNMHAYTRSGHQRHNGC